MPNDQGARHLDSAPKLNKLQWERALDPFINAISEPAADRSLDYLIGEFVTPLVISTLARELRRGPSGSMSRIWADNEAFREIQSSAETSLVQRLRRLRAERYKHDAVSIRDLYGYVRASARHAYADYMREHLPGRHSLDTALRAAFGASPDLALWRHMMLTDYYEWRCGKPEWKTNNVQAVSLQANEELRAFLIKRIREGAGTRSEILRRIFEVAQAPLHYMELLDILAVHWDVEAPYRYATLESSLLRIHGLSPSGEDPADVAQLIGTLQEVWERLKPLSTQQRAVLLLRLPEIKGSNLLLEIVRLGIAEASQVEEALGLLPGAIYHQLASLPMEDSDIAKLLKIPVDDVRRIRQDARRRLSRQRPPPI